MMLDITIKINNILWQRPKRGAILTGFVIGEGLPLERSERVRIPYSVSIEDRISSGQWWRIVGDTEDYKGDMQIVATHALLLRPSGEHIVDLIAGDRHRFPGIGKSYARKLWDHLGNNLYELLEAKNDIDLGTTMRKLKIPNAEQASTAMVEGWSELGLGEVVYWLDNLPSAINLGIGLGERICKCWGVSARKRIEEDPYRLISFISTRHVNKAWKTVDDIALNVFGLAHDDERRLHAAIIDSIYSHYDNKSTVVDRKTLVTKTKNRLGSRSLAEKAIGQSYGRNSFLHNDEFWQSRGAYLMEREIAERIKRILNFKQNQFFCEKDFEDADIAKAIEEFEDKETKALRAIGTLGRDEMFHLDEEQKKAVRVCLDNNLSIVTGGTSVGKASVLECVNHITRKTGGDVVQMSLFGRAPRHMSKATGQPTKTIAGFLCKSSAEDIKEGMTYVVEEASTLDLPTTFQILRKLPENSRLILVGDAEQLPPLGPGKVFHLLVKELAGMVPTSTLTKVYSQEGSSGIPAVAEAIRGSEDASSTMPNLPAYTAKGSGVSVYKATTTTAIYKAVEKVYADHRENSPDTDVQILTATETSADSINILLQNKYASDKKRVLVYNTEFMRWSNSSAFAEGDPVMFTYNNWERDLLNGSLGRIIKVYNQPKDNDVDAAHTKSANICFDTGAKNLTVKEVDSLTLAYAIKVQKAQGRQHKRVIIPLLKGATLIDKAWVYTAVTRGIEQVVFVGDIDIAKAAVESDVVADKRQVGLGHMLKFILSQPVL